MPATFINVALILLGSLLGLLFRGRIPPRFSSGLTFALGLCVLGIGISNMIATADTLCVIICMVVGTLLGEVIDIEKRMEGAGELLRRRLIRGEGNSRFVEGFVNATVLFCVGAMAINGAMAAGMQGDYSILISKSVIDGVTAVTFAAAMGVGVAFSARHRDVCRGGYHHCGHRPEHAGPAQGEAPRGQYAACYLSAAGLCAAEQLAERAGGVKRAADCPPRAAGRRLRRQAFWQSQNLAIAGIHFRRFGWNQGLPPDGTSGGSNMLPAIFLPLAYVPLSGWLSGLVG